MASNNKSNKAAKPKDDLTTSLNLSNRDVEVLIKGYNCMKEGAQVSINIHCLAIFSFILFKHTFLPSPRER